MANTNYPDLSKPMGASDEYPDLSIPMNASDESGSQAPAPKKDYFADEKKEFNISPNERLNRFKDIATGVMTGSQKIASLGLEGAEIATRKVAEALPGAGTVPKWDARTAMGLGADRPFNFQDYIGPDKPNAERQQIASYIPGMLAGGVRLPTAMASNAFSSAAQAEPGQENAFGYLPSGRTGAAIEGGVLGAAPYVFGKAFTTAKNLLTPVGPDKVAKSIQLAHDTLEKSATSLFDKVGNEAVKRKVNIIPVDKQLITDIGEHSLLPKTKRMKSLISDAKNGDYQALRDLQSELWHRATKGAKSQLPSDNNAAEELFELRDDLNSSITDHFKNTGNEDLANDLLEARGKYKNLKDTYFARKTPAAIKNLVHPESRAIPKNVVKTLANQSVPNQRILNANPIAAEKVAAYNSKQNALKTLKWLTPLGLGAAGAIFGPSAYQKVKSIF